MSFLEDLGYLPRLAVLLDGWLHRIGLHGYAGIPAILGLGCKVPAIMATRILESKREKFIAMVLICLVAPCLPQSAMIFSVLGKYGFFYLGVVFGVTFLAGLTSSFLLGRILKGETPELFLEIPAYQWPALPMLLKKLWMRVKGFLFEAVPLIAVGVFIVNILEIFGGLRFLTKIFSPVVTRFLGLPAELVSIVMVGFLRKDISIALLLPYHLTAKQLTVAVTFLVLYLPCLATFFVVLKELGLKDTLKILLLTLSVAFLTAIILNILII
jgi:ferrous iron transport protein B